jgi:hypothetical protein
VREVRGEGELFFSVLCTGTRGFDPPGTLSATLLIQSSLEVYVQS